MSFAASLSVQDRRRLRAVVKKTHRHFMTTGDEPDDLMCDELIDALGPEVQERMLKQIIDGGLA